MSNDPTTPTAQLRHWAELKRDDPFVMCGGDWVSFSSLQRQATQLAVGFSGLGIRPGDRIALILPNCDEIVTSLFAALAGGYVCVPLNTYLKGEFLRHQMADSGASALVTDQAGLASVAAVIGRESPLKHIVVSDGAAENSGLDSLGVRFHRLGDLVASTAIGPVHNPKPEDTAAILYTSGTTGMPKGCMVSHGYMANRLAPWAAAGWIQPDDVLFSPMPLFHGGAILCVLMPALAGGMRAAFDNGFSVTNFMRRAKAVGATYTMLPGPMAVAMLNTPASAADKDHVVARCALNPMPPELQVKFEQRYGVKVMTRVFGQTEIVPATLGAWSLPLEGRRNSGHPVAGIRLKLVDDAGNECGAGEVGEISIFPETPHAMFQGYWNAADAAPADGWHRSGDLGVIDALGQLKFADRKKDSMRRRGENVSSFELERAISMFPGVEAVAVHAVTSDLGEDEIKACIVEERPGMIEPAPLFKYLKNSVPYFAIPRYVEIVPNLPENAMKRIMKQTLRERGIGDAWDFEAMGLYVLRSERRG